MKSNKNPRGQQGFDAGDLMKKAVRLDPIRKSGKEKMSFKNVINEEEDDIDLMSYKKKESVLDYFDDGEEDEEEWEDDNEDEFDDEEYEGEEDYDEEDENEFE
ncbi:MAG: hypothetical protein LIO79_01080 [Rikenellaceae bacterium]|nr:hypothetical protein [Rikenellaceae bacterium]